MSFSVPGLAATWSADVREMTLSEPIFARRVRISSWMPAAKYAASGSELRFLNGSTAIEASVLRAGGGAEDLFRIAIAAPAASTTVAMAAIVSIDARFRDGASATAGGDARPTP